ncbi:MAG: acylphosphatase [Candidatus Micrarchaeaceae archaeon]
MPTRGQLPRGNLTKVYAIVHGHVQGVGYRSFVRGIAYMYGIKGFVENSPDGSVRVLAIGDAEAIDKFLKAISVDQPNGPSVAHIETINEDDPEFPKHEDVDGFFIRR